MNALLIVGCLAISWFCTDTAVKCARAGLWGLGLGCLVLACANAFAAFSAALG